MPLLLPAMSDFRSTIRADRTSTSTVADAVLWIPTTSHPRDRSSLASTEDNSPGRTASAAVRGTGAGG